MVGVGNLLLKDEGIGVHVARALQEMELPDGTEIIDGGTVPDLLAYTGAEDRLLIIDAVAAGGAPGTVYRFHPDDLAAKAGEPLSLHELDLTASLGMMRLAKREPAEVTIIGIQPDEIDWGTELSAELQEKLPEIVRTVRKELDADRQDTLK